MELWEIIKLCTENSLNKGDKFKAINIPFPLIIEYNGSDLIYNKLWNDTTKREVVSLCGGEINADYIKLNDIEYFKINIIDELMKQGYSKNEVENLYKISNIDKILDANVEYVLHYNIEHWINWINWFRKNKIKT